MSSEEKRGRLPFEPRQNKQKKAKKDSAKAENKSAKPSQGSEKNQPVRQQILAEAMLPMEVYPLSLM